MDGAPASESTAEDPLAELEADFAAVDAALTSLDQIELDGRSGATVVAEISAVVDPERFDRPAPGRSTAPPPQDAPVEDDPAAGLTQSSDSDLVGDGFVDEQVDSGTD